MFIKKGFEAKSSYILYYRESRFGETRYIKIL